MAFQILFGLESQRSTVKLKIAELLYTMDTQRLYIGDGVTMGGNQLKSGDFDELDFLDTEYLADNQSDGVPSQRAVKQFIEDAVAGFQRMKGVAGSLVPTNRVASINPTSVIFTLTLPEVKLKSDPTYNFSTNKFPGESVLIVNESDVNFVNVVASDGSVVIENMAPGGIAVVVAQDSPNTWGSSQGLSATGVSDTGIVGYVPDPNKLPVTGSINPATNKFELYLDSSLASGLLGLGTLAFKNLVEEIDLADDSVGTAAIQDLAITGAKIQDNSVTGNKLSDNSVTGNKIQNDTIEGYKLKDSAVTGDKIAPNTITGDNIQFDSIDVSKLSDIASAKITPDANSYIFGTIDLTTGRYSLELDFSRAGFGALAKLDKVREQDFESGAVTEYAIAPAAINTQHFADESVETHAIADEAVTEDKIGREEVTESRIADENVTTRKLADRSVTTEKLGEESVTTSKIADRAVTTRTIDNLAVTTEKIADRAVTEPKLADNAVSNRTIQDSAVSTSKIANGAITTDKIDYNSVFNDSGVQNRLRVEHYDEVTYSGTGGNFSGSFTVTAPASQGRVIISASYAMAPANDGDSEHSMTFISAKLRLKYA